MASGDTSPVSVSKRPGRFSLLELFILTALVCLAGAFFSWARAEPAGFAAPLFVGALIGAVGFAIHMFTRWSPGEMIAVLAVVVPLTCLFLAPVGLMESRGGTRRASCENNLHNIALALIQYHDDYGSYPPPYIADAKGKPMHSWRVLLLPYLDQRNLYKQYNFNEPWDGPNNSKLHNLVLKIYCCPSHSAKQPMTETSYVAVVGSKTVWITESDKIHPVRMADITDGASATILLVEVETSGIHWMEARDLHMTQMATAINSPRGQGISSGHAGGVNVAFADGSVRFLDSNTSPATLRALLTRNGKEPPIAP
jgi:prepilin-type processing-associated H-X9-DG protein